jgi:hypothetical protein
MSPRQLLMAAGVGAGAMYFWDPLAGRRRRALVRDQVTRTTKRLQEELRVEGRDTANRARGLLAEAKALLRPGAASDEVVQARVLSTIGRVGTHASALAVTVQDGTVRLGGAVPADEAARVRRAVERVRGVRRVEDRLEVGSVEPLPVPARRAGRAMVPAARLLLGSLGAAGAIAAAAYRPLAVLGGGGLGLLGLAIAAVERSRMAAQADVPTRTSLE